MSQGNVKTSEYWVCSCLRKLPKLSKMGLLVISWPTLKFRGECIGVVVVTLKSVDVCRRDIFYSVHLPWSGSVSTLSCHSLNRKYKLQIRRNLYFSLILCEYLSDHPLLLAEESSQDAGSIFEPGTILTAPHPYSGTPYRALYWGNSRWYPICVYMCSSCTYYLLPSQQE